LRAIHLAVNLLFLWITLDWKVRKTRKAFEKVLVQQGIPKTEAKKLSKPIKTAKDQILNSIWQSAFSQR
jgi:hypothetical protein